MKKRFDKLPYRTCVGDLEISPSNRQYIERFIQHLKGYVAESRADERPGTSDDGGYARIMETERFEQHPSLHNNVLVFQDWHDGNSVIYARNLTTGQEIQVTEKGEGRHPNVYHDVIVWQDIRNGTDDIYMARLPFGFVGGANVDFSQADFDRDGDVDLTD